MIDEYDLAVNPLVPESVQHNSKVFADVRSATAFLFGAAAGTLGLESAPGFAFFLVGTLVTSALFLLLRTQGQDTKRFFFRPVADVWMFDLFGSFMSFVLTWTLFYGMVRA